LELWVALPGVIVGFILSEVKSWCERQRKLNSIWKALKCEIETCRTKAREYTTERIGAPLYRLPTKVYESFIPELVYDGGLGENEFDKLQVFFQRAIDLNRGLDLIATENSDDPVKSKEMYEKYTKRNNIYAKKLIAEAEGDAYPEANGVIEKHLRKQPSIA